MRIITWNCQAGFLSMKKGASLFEREPDIAIVQECSKSDATSFRQQGYKGLWFGDTPKKGMAVFHKSQWKLHPPKQQPKHKWIAPVEVEGPENFTLLAVWACAVKGNRRESYVGLIHSALAAHPEITAGVLAS